MLPTAAADAFLGAGAAGLATGEPLLSALPAAVGVSMSLYAGGMVLNDICDARSDSEEGRARPIASGEISKNQALIVFAFLWLIAAGFAAMLPSHAWPLVALCALLVLTYNLTHKKLRTISPFLMGGARVADVGIAVAAVSGSALPLVENHGVIAVLGSYGFYVVAVTFYSLLEDKRDSGMLASAIVGSLLSAVAVVPLSGLVGEHNAALWGMLMMAVNAMFIIGGLYIYFSGKHRKALGAFVPFFLSPLCLLGGLGFVFISSSIEPQAGIVPAMVLAATYPFLASYMYYRAHKATQAE
jgi:4-hydroxybenzoate polyprenyltransferase